MVTNASLPLLSLFPLRIISQPFRTAVSLQRQKNGRDSIQEPTVMGDKDESARKLQEAFFQHVESRNIRMVRRFIEKEQVRRLEHQPGNQQPRLLSSGKP